MSLTSIELFAGGGGLSLGCHKAGFENLAMVEWHTYSTETLKLNFPKISPINIENIINDDVRKVELLNSPQSSFVGKLDLLSGGPPCQPFSTSGKSLGFNDDRDMFPSFLDICSNLHPKAMIIENVKGLLRSRFKDYVDYILKRIEFPSERIRINESWYEHLCRLNKISYTDIPLDEQYEVGYQLVDAANFGIPQRRERVFFIAFRKDLNIKPFILNETHSRQSLLYDQWITGDYWQRHNIHPRKDHLINRDHILIKGLQPKLFQNDSKKPWVTVRDALFYNEPLPKPVDRGENPTVLNHTQHPGAKIYKCHVGSFFDFPSKALKAGTHGTPGGENMLRCGEEFSDDVRYFTTREAARIQTFPDFWDFQGPWGACIRQLGNAVPMELGYIFSKEVHKRLLTIGETDD